MTTQGLKPRQDSAPILPDEAAEAYGPIPLRLPSAWRMTDAIVEELCGLNPDIRLEINAEGELELMPPAFSITGNRNHSIAVDLGVWARIDGRGVSLRFVRRFHIVQPGVALARCILDSQKPVGGIDG